MRAVPSAFRTYLQHVSLLPHPLSPSSSLPPHLLLPFPSLRPDSSVSVPSPVEREPDEREPLRSHESFTPVRCRRRRRRHRTTARSNNVLPAALVTGSVLIVAGSILLVMVKIDEGVKIFKEVVERGLGGNFNLLKGTAEIFVKRK